MMQKRKISVNTSVKFQQGRDGALGYKRKLDHFPIYKYLRKQKAFV